MTKKREHRFLHYIAVLFTMRWLSRKIVWRHVEKRVGNVKPRGRIERPQRKSVPACGRSGFVSTGLHHWANGKGKKRKDVT